MKRLCLLWGFLLIFIFIFIEEVVAKVEPQALIISVKGAVLVKEKGKKEWRKAKIGSYLKEGDTIKTKAKSSAKILLVQGEVKTIAEKRDYIIEKDRGKLAKVSLFATIIRNIPHVFEKVEETSEVGGIRLRESSNELAAQNIRLISPRGSRIISNFPTFEYTGIEGTATYQVILKDGEKEIWREETMETKVAFPSSEKGLTPQKKYSWCVYVKQDGEWIRSEHTYFEVLAPEKALELQRIKEELEKSDELNPNTPEFYIIMGMICESNSLFHEAIDYYRMLIEIFPKNKDGYTLLSSVYERIDLYEEALKTLKELKKIQQ